MRKCSKLDGKLMHSHDLGEHRRNLRLRHEEKIGEYITAAIIFAWVVLVEVCGLYF